MDPQLATIRYSKTKIQIRYMKSQDKKNQETKDQIFRVYFSYGKANSKGKYQKGFVKVTATSHKEAREKAIEMGPSERIKVLKWNNVMLLDKDQKN